VNKAYTDSFNGTSSAAPIIAGAAIIVQGMSKANSGIHIAPDEMRNILSAPGIGTPQSPAVAGHIGVMPDLRAIITAYGGFQRCPIPGPPTAAPRRIRLCR
jgi:serine protease